MRANHHAFQKKKKKNNIHRKLYLKITLFKIKKIITIYLFNKKKTVSHFDYKKKKSFVKSVLLDRMDPYSHRQWVSGGSVNVVRGLTKPATLLNFSFNFNFNLTSWNPWQTQTDRQLRTSTKSILHVQEPEAQCRRAVHVKIQTFYTWRDMQP